MCLFRSSKPVQRIALLLAVIVVNFASVAPVQAAWCLFGCVNAEISGSVKFPSSAEFREMGQALAKGVREEMEKTDFKAMGKQFAEGVRGEFDKAMDRLFDEKIDPLVADIDKLLKARLNAVDKMAKDRLAQLDKIIADRLKQVDKLIQNTFDQFNTVAKETIGKLKTDLIDNAFTQFNEAIEKTKTDLIDNTFTQIDDLRKNLRMEVDHFFDRTEYLINTVDCKVEGMVEKIRMDIEKTGEILAQQLKTELSSLGIKMEGSLLTGFSGEVFIKPESDSTLAAKPLTQCYQELGLMAPPKPWEYSTIYDLEKCNVLKTLTPNTPMKRILNVYLDLKAYAARMACVQRGAGHHATLHYTWDWLAFGYWYDFWYHY
jgi:ElaB/YqjD/DUF883 family membrane-anchored ribosome-binding protein